MATSQPFSHILAKTQQACRTNSTDGLSMGEALAAALVLNRSDWLEEMNYTICQAMYRLDQDWLDLLPAVEKAVRADHR